MSELQNTLIELSAWLAQSAVNLVLQSTALILIGLIAAWILRRQGSAVQSAIYRATLVAVLVCPFASLGLNAAGWSGWTLHLPETTSVVSYEAPLPESPQPIASVVPFDAGVLLSEPPSENVASVIPGNEYNAEFNLSTLPTSDSALPDVPIDETLNATEPNSASLPPVLLEKSTIHFASVIAYSAIAVAWCFGSLLLFLRLGFAYRRLGLIRKESPIADSTEVAMCRRIANDISVRPPEVRRNSLLSSPCLTGVVQPTILLPTEIEERVPLEKAFAHELAHLRRHDTFWNLIQRTAIALFFFQPLLWRLVYRLETTAEEVCDDAVVRHCHDRTGYAQQLVDLAGSNLLAPNAAGLGMFSGKTLLGHRVGRILDTTRKLTTHVSGPIIATIATTALSAAILGGLIGSGTVTIPSSGKSLEESGASDTANDDLVHVSGRILDHTGKPVGGASVKIFPAIHHLHSAQPPGAHTTTTSDPDGSFTAEFRLSQLLDSGHPLIPRESNFKIVATKQGHGIQWFQAKNMTFVGDGKTEPRLYAPVDIFLTTDRTPIRLKLIDTEGNPIVNARVRIKGVETAKANDLSPILDAGDEGKTFFDISSCFGDSLAFHDLPTYQSNEKGEVVIQGIGDNRIVGLEITGPTIVTKDQSHMVLDHATIQFSYGESVPDQLILYGATSTVTCEPTQLIVGQVIDSKTKQPLEGVRILSWKFAGELLAGVHHFETTSGPDGRFELTGMPKGEGNVITVIASTDAPYFPKDVDLPTAPGLDVVEMKIELERGIWIRGKAIDKQTGEPIVGARLHYMPFLSNDVASQSTVYAAGTAQVVQARDETQRDGSFQLVGFPGRAIIGIHDIQDKYATGMGWEGIDASEKKGEPGYAKTLTLPAPSRLWPTAMQQVEIAVGADEFAIDFELDSNSGLTIPLEIVTADGQPLTGVKIKRLTSPLSSFFTNTDSIVQASGFKKNEKRLIRFEHDERKISRVIELDSSQFDLAKDARPQRVELIPNSIVIGRLVDANGDPIAGASIRFDVGGGQNFGMMLPRVATDKNGEFKHESVCPGTHYSILAQWPDNVKSVSKRLDVPTSERIDLGTINIEDPMRPAPQRSAISPALVDNDTIHVSGRILDHAGNPVGGASVKIFPAIHHLHSAKPPGAYTTTTSEPDGSFTAKFRSSQLLDSGHPIVSREKNFKIVATKPGHGIHWFHAKDMTFVGGEKAGPRDYAPVDIFLTTDRTPVRLKMIDTEGNPIVNARVKIKAIQTVEENDLSPILGAAEEGKGYAGISSCFDDYLAFHGLPSYRSNEKGEIVIQGIGDNRIVGLEITGPTIVAKDQSHMVLDHSTVQFSYGGMTPSGVTFYGATSTVTCEPTQPITGQVIDSKTKQPLEGVRILSWKFAGEIISGLHHLETTTGPNGRFELTGMPRGEGNRISVIASDDQPYFAKGLDVPTAPGLDAIELKIELERGIWIRGKAIDKLTGEPIVGARLHYIPFLSNDAASQSPVFAAGTSRVVQARDETQRDGSFQMVGLPGRAIVGLQDIQGKYPSGIGWESVDASEKDDETGKAKTFRRPFRPSQSWPTTMQQVEIAEGADEIVVDFELDSGLTFPLEIVTADGEPLTGVMIERLNSPFTSYFSNTDSIVQASGFKKNEKRLIRFEHDERKISRVIELDSSQFDSADDAHPRRVELIPNSIVSGRLIDSNGDPMAGVIIRFDIGGAQDFGMSLSKVATDKNGEFKHESVYPGTHYSIVALWPDNLKSLAKRLDVPKSESIDLGTIQVGVDNLPTPKRKPLPENEVP